MARVTLPTALGPCVVEWEDALVTAFRLPGDRSAADPMDSISLAPPWVRGCIARIQRHLSGDLEDFADLPYAFATVSPFQRSVYQGALTIKAGETSTYGQLAALLGLPPAASRAVGTALGRNPWPLLVPCHRFVSAGGKMTGFSAPGGIATKLRLLEIEGAQWFRV